MSYVKNTWSDGDVITATKINNIENGIAANDTKASQLQSDLDALEGTVDGEFNSLKADLSQYIENIASTATVISGLFINPSGVITALSSGENDRTICIEAEPNHKYFIKKNTSTVMRVGCYSSDAATAGAKLIDYSGHSTASTDFLYVETDIVNKYIYIQLFASSDTQSLKTIEANTATLIVASKEDTNKITQENNLYDGIKTDGFWMDKTMDSASKYTPYESIKINYLPKGDYKISFENDIRVIRKVICDQIFTVGYDVTAKTPFYFNVPFDNAPIGFSFAGRSSGTSVLYNGYILIEKDGETVSADKLTSQDIIAEKDIAYLKGITSILDGVQVSKTDDFMIGAIGSSSVNVRNDRACTITYYPVQRGDMVFFKIPEAASALNLGFSVARFSEPKYSGYINTVSWYRNDYGDNQQLRTPYIVTNENYIRFTLTSGTGSQDLSEITFDDVFYILHPSDRSLQMFNLMYGENEPISGKKPVKYSAEIGQDGTFIDGKLWCFTDGVSSGSIKVFDIDTDTVTETKTHNLGHANTVDYNPNNKTLACFYTESHKPHILLYKDPADAETLLKTDADCMIIPLYDGTTQMSSTGGLCWGENDNVIYFMDGVYSHYDGETGVAADEINITKILLGRGDNDLSENGYGTFVEGKAESEYNGTCAILKQYKGSMKDVLAWTMISGGSSVRVGLQTIQGMEYDGYLYIGWGTSAHNYLKIQLDDNRGIYSIAYNYKYLYTDYKNAPYYREPELVALTPDRIFCGDANGNLLAFSR